MQAEAVELFPDCTLATIVRQINIKEYRSSSLCPALGSETFWGRVALVGVELAAARRPIPSHIVKVEAGPESPDREITCPILAAVHYVDEAARMIKADDKEVLELKVAAWDELARNVIGKVKNAN